MHASLISLVKVVGKLNIAEHARLPQMVMFLKTSMKSVDVRVSITPTVLGEKSSNASFR